MPSLVLISQSILILLPAISTEVSPGQSSKPQRGGRNKRSPGSLMPGGYGPAAAPPPPPSPQTANADANAYAKFLVKYMELDDITRQNIGHQVSIRDIFNHMMFKCLTIDKSSFPPALGLWWHFWQCVGSLDSMHVCRLGLWFCENVVSLPGQQVWQLLHIQRKLRQKWHRVPEEFILNWIIKWWAHQQQMCS